MLLAFFPTPYWIIAPGTAVDLRAHVRMDGYSPSPRRYFLTDVTLYHASLLILPAAYLPGMRVVRRDEVIPNGVSVGVYNRLLLQDMDDSQNAAAVVAERAAGLAVRKPALHIYVADILSDSKAKGVLRAGDVLLSVGGRVLTAASDVAGTIKRYAPGTDVPITLRRNDRVEHFHVLTMRSTSSEARLGIMVQARPEKAVLPVAVHCSLRNISGSSGGLMLALQMYDTLRPNQRRGNASIAGTGTVTYDGVVGPVEGVEQKIIAAERAGLRFFLMPKENYRDITLRHNIRIMPVGTFAEALAALKTVTE
jgi:PDZ domain-containing protein